ncbi:uncharacterized protein Asalp_04740 [Aeromonas salmonicida subsp. pectinolytica 34mel]|uniref:Uncharacterized protein n=1 Tax=Aeromonas salmonicida subsp. pectinolytica 34mel TaxID=1324960 RepID=A0A2D1QBU1_AERSA|nr:uncharacterized protein Asalp_04740 [Aeromonas salmonicida subsp. pectinolytica 34mel]
MSKHHLFIVIPLGFCISRTDPFEYKLNIRDSHHIDSRFAQTIKSDSNHTKWVIAAKKIEM